MARITVQIDDDVMDKYIEIAKTASSTVPKLIEKNLDMLFKLDPKENQILLDGKSVAAISEAVGGKILKTQDEVVKMFKDFFTISVNGSAVQLDIEDVQALKDQRSSYPHLTLEKFIEGNVRDGLSLVLWGSTRGALI